MQAGGDGFRGGRAAAAAAGHGEQVGLVAVRAHDAVSRPWAFGRFCRMAAPAPSPNSTQVLRSVQSTMDESFSAPMTSTVS